jgi:hypothetical protein
VIAAVVVVVRLNLPFYELLLLKGIGNDANESVF